MVAERVGRPVRETEFPAGPWGGPATNEHQAMAPKDAETRAGGPGASGRPGQTPRSEPQPEVIEEEEFTEIQSDVQEPSPLTRTPIDGISLTPQPTRSPGARVGGVGGSPDSTSTSELGSVPTRLELQRQIRQQDKLQQQIKSKLVRATLNMQESIDKTQAKLDSTKVELWEAIEDEIQERKQDAPDLQEALSQLAERLEHDLRVRLEKGIETLGDAVDARLLSIENKLEELEDRLITVADHAQRGVDAAVKEVTEKMSWGQQKEPSDWSDWSLLDNEEFQELARRVEALEAEWTGNPGVPVHSRIDNLDELYSKMECRVADLEIGGTHRRPGGGVGLPQRDSQRHVMESKAISNLSPLTDDPTAFRQWDAKMINALAHLKPGYGRAISKLKEFIDKGQDPDDTRHGASAGRLGSVSGPTLAELIKCAAESMDDGAPNYGTYDSPDVDQLGDDLSYILIDKAKI